MINQGAAIAYTIMAIDKATRPLREVGKGADSLMKKMLGMKKSTESSANGMTRAFDRMKNALIGMGASFAGFSAFKTMISTGANFEEAISKIAIITGASGADLKYYSDESIRLSQKWGIAAADIATSIKDVGSAKSELLGTPQALVSVTETAIKLAKASGLTASESVKSITDALNQFKFGAEKAEQFADILAQSANVGASEIPEITEAMKMVGVTAKLNNATFAETNTLLQLMAKGGLKGSMAGVGLAGVMAGMKKKLDWDPNKVGIFKALKEVKKAKDAGKLNLLDVFGVEHERSAGVILENLEYYDKFLKQIEKAGELERQSSIAQQTFNAKLAIIKEKINAKLIATFEKLLPTLEKFTNEFTVWLDTLDDKKVSKFTSSLKGLLTVLEGIVTVIGKFAGAGEMMGTLAAQLVTGEGYYESQGKFNKEDKDRLKMMSGSDIESGEEYRMFKSMGKDSFDAMKAGDRKRENARAEKVNATNNMLNVGQKVFIELKDPSKLVKDVTSEPFVFPGLGGKTNFSLQQ